MPLAKLEQQLAFLREIDQLKSVVRLSPLINRSRRENSAEHSWHLAMYALVLAEYAAAPVNILRVVKMLEAAEVRLIVAEVPASDRTLRAQQD